VSQEPRTEPAKGLEGSWAPILAVCCFLLASGAIVFALIVHSDDFDQPLSRGLTQSQLFVAIGGMLPIGGMVVAGFLGGRSRRLFWWCASAALLTYAVWGDLCARALQS
jgi:hypothetical protein